MLLRQWANTDASYAGRLRFAVSVCVEHLLRADQVGSRSGVCAARIRGGLDPAASLQSLWQETAAGAPCMPSALLGSCGEVSVSSRLDGCSLRGRCALGQTQAARQNYFGLGLSSLRGATSRRLGVLKARFQFLRGVRTTSNRQLRRLASTLKQESAVLPVKIEVGLVRGSHV